MLLERRDAVAVVRLNRPERRNALDSATLGALNDLMDDLAADETLRVVVLSTTDTTALCAGADVSEQLDHAGGVARMAAFTRIALPLAMPGVVSVGLLWLGTMMAQIWVKGFRPDRSFWM